jgi:hypothetical protein
VKGGAASMHGVIVKVGLRNGTKNQIYAVLMRQLVGRAPV